MSVQAYSRFVAVLALIALATALALLLPWVRRRLVASGMGGSAAWLAFLVAAVSTAGSLLYSEVFGFEPCRLCWYQRIAMYPLAAVTLVGAIRRDRNLGWYALPIAGLGLVIALYHYLLQTFPGLDTGACAAGVPCSAKYVNAFGFVSIPFMAASGFAAIAALLGGGLHPRSVPTEVP